VEKGKGKRDGGQPPIGGVSSFRSTNGRGLYEENAGLEGERAGRGVKKTGVAQ
jgi:hypothetical protein